MTAFPNLQGHNFMSLTTFRKSGEAVVTPVWFAQEEDWLYVYTNLTSGKVKRIRHTPNVTVAPCKYNGELLGETLPATVRLIPVGSDEAKHASVIMNKKYGLQKRMIDWMDRLRGRQDQTQYLELRPS